MQPDSKNISRVWSPDFLRCDDVMYLMRGRFLFDSALEKKPRNLRNFQKKLELLMKARERLEIHFIHGELLDKNIFFRFRNLKFLV